MPTASNARIMVFQLCIVIEHSIIEEPIARALHPFTPSSLLPLTPVLLFSAQT
jgi:hypothetical protein